MTSFTVDDAVAIARRAHEGQLDKAGHPYIDHPLRVMARVEGDSARMVAVLHDVLEDTPISAGDLLTAGCPHDVVDAVEAITHTPREPMADYLRRVASNPLASVVKRADIADNTDPARLRQLDGATQDRLRTKYARSLALLQQYGG